MLPPVLGVGGRLSSNFLLLYSWINVLDFEISAGVPLGLMDDRGRYTVDRHFYRIVGHVSHLELFDAGRRRQFAKGVLVNTWRHRFDATG